MKIFIGSSNEQYPVVKEIKRDLREKLSAESLRGKVEIVDWKEWFSRAEFTGEYFWKVLERAFEHFDLAIMLMAADDDLVSRDEELVITRDNVLIEAGAFAHAIGIKNVILLVATDKNLKKPSDFLGINYILFDYARGAENPDAYKRIIGKIAQVQSEIESSGGMHTPLIKPKQSIEERHGKLK